VYRRIVWDVADKFRAQRVEGSNCGKDSKQDLIHDQLNALQEKM
jgi:hypothetical protein